MASSTRLPRAGRAGRYGLPARAIAIAVVGAFLWVLPASPFLTFDDLDADREVGVPEVAEAELGLDSLVTGSITNPFDNEIFRGANRAAKTDRYRPAQSALEIAASFAPARLRIASLRAGGPGTGERTPDGETIAVAEAGPDNATAEAPRVELASLGPAEPVVSDALDAISALSGESADPDHPVPLTIPERLAYARENAPATTHTGTLMPAMSVSAQEQRCMAEAIYFEARGEPYRGQVAVAQVVRNRVAHPLYPNTICGVVFQNQSRRNSCQFSFACDGRPERVTEDDAWARAQEISAKMIDGELYLTEVGRATHYHANYVYPHWASRMTRVVRIDHHIFYRFRNS